MLETHVISVKFQRGRGVFTELILNFPILLEERQAYPPLFEQSLTYSAFIRHISRL